MTLLRVLAAAALALLPGCTAPAEARSTWKQVFPLQRQKTFTVASEGVAVSVTPPPPYDDDAEDTHDSFRASYGDVLRRIMRENGYLQ